MLADKDLLHLCKQNNAGGQAALYQKYKSRLMGICRRYARDVEDAEDIFQEGFIKVFQRIHQLENDDLMWPWMKRVFVNTAIDYYNKYIKNGNFESYDNVQLANDDFESITQQMTNIELVQIINELPVGCRTVFNLYVIDGYTHPQISELLGITDGTSKAHLSHAKTMLRAKLKKLGIVRYEKF